MFTRGCWWLIFNTHWSSRKSSGEDSVPCSRLLQQGRHLLSLNPGLPVEKKNLPYYFTMSPPASEAPVVSRKQIHPYCVFLSIPATFTYITTTDDNTLKVQLLSKAVFYYRIMQYVMVMYLNMKTDQNRSQQNKKIKIKKPRNGNILWLLLTRIMWKIKAHKYVSS